VALLLTYITVSAGIVAHALSTSDSCVWSPGKEAYVMRLFRAVYGDSIKDYLIYSVKLVSYDENPLTCMYRVTLKNKVTNTELVFNVYEMFGKVDAFRIYLPPAERLRSIDLGDVGEGSAFSLDPKALEEIDRFIQAVRDVLAIPALGDITISLRKAAPDGLVLIDGRLSNTGNNPLLRRGAADVRLGNDLTAEVVYIWNRDGTGSLSVHIYRNFTVGPGAEVKYHVMSVHFFRLRGEWVPYGVGVAPFPLRFGKVSNSPSAFLEKAEQAALQMSEQWLGTPCRVVKARFTEAWAMDTPKLVNGTLYRESITYVYDVTLDCGKEATTVRVLINASTGVLHDVSPMGVKNHLGSGQGTGEEAVWAPSTYLIMGGAPAAAVLAFAVLRRWARAGH